MAELANGIGRWTDWVHYRSVAKARSSSLTTGSRVLLHDLY